eukprot:CAMPEP_0202445220 /NCGR_PEP_ID=MMETSP1360-20130828/4082_1 /ASSEMBLY_ACC=CAM_ASM_000848 /TAXON_ID=515479 /ORGANISM="Licmophora paradoxa, Strain CCMP2313" /LENGTH=397 /DNA_ID=CAMNT_0049061405 /DNA_START=15 /DNA_END=1208 /DNA_ORIENTATION=+
MRLTLLLTTLAVAFAQDDPEQSLRGRRLTHFLDPKSVAIKSADGNPRKFLSYESSEWEKMWLENVDEWASNEAICDVLNSDSQKRYVHDFLNATCTNRFQPPHESWCVMDDEFPDRPLYYNTANRDTFEFSWVNPFPATALVNVNPEPFHPTSDLEHVFSKYTYLDETTGETYVEYIEPLVSHLRFPLCKCATFQPMELEARYHWYQITFKGWVIPPPGVRNKRKFFFDAGASDWNQGAGGPSLKYFFNMWKRHGIDIDQIYAYEMTTTVNDFYKTVPDQYKDFIHYQQCSVSSSPEEDSADHPFLPHMIKREARPEDYVLFKLDIDSPHIEDNTIDYIINDPDNFIDEVAWEHHIGGNYLMKEWGNLEQLAKFTLRQSYELFLKMRLKGIRAHSWI